MCINFHYYNFAEDKFLTFDGPFELHLWMDAYTLMFFNPSSRYWEWLEMTDEDLSSGENIITRFSRLWEVTG